MGFVTDLKQWALPTNPNWTTLGNAVTKAGQFGIEQLEKYGSDALVNATGIPMQDIPEGIGQLGTFVYSTVSFILDDEEVLSPINKAVQEINFIQKTNLGYIVTFEDVAMTVTQKKNITMTKIDGRDDTVKEYVSNGDFNITMSIRLNSLWARVMPTMKIRQMFQILKRPKPVQVSSRYLNFFNIDTIVITNFSMKQVRGKVNTQMVNITAVSDSPIEIRTLTNENKNIKTRV